MTEGLGDAAVSRTPMIEAEWQQAQAELAQLLHRAEQGDLAALPALRAALDADERLWRGYGDLAMQAIGSLIKLAAGTNVLLAESLLRKVQTLKEELAGESPSALDKLLAERVAATWLQTNYYDGLMVQAAKADEARSRMLQRQQDAAHRRHLAALKTLAVVRRLLKPAVSPVDLALRPLPEGRPQAGAKHARLHTPVPN
jgi:hypothetical protein